MEATRSVEEIVDELWLNKETLIPVGSNDLVNVSLELMPNDWFRIMMNHHDKGTKVGYVMVKRKDDGRYDLMNNPRIIPDPQFSGGYYGIEVNPNYQRRSFGTALLSLGIGIAQRDFIDRGATGNFRFELMAMTGDLSDKFYRNFGLDIYDPPNKGRYTKLDKVPELKIKQV